MQRFTIPREVYTGDDAIEVLRDLKGKKALSLLVLSEPFRTVQLPRCKAF